ncbi:MAG TPA: YdcF family protein [Gemmatimonadaceae bacterium]|jgi:uncharacterized SAM-binding protein YcdF (DUF218 family)|nr:YdcF family protein [Gemmatimonadaceae bacterium]
MHIRRPPVTSVRALALGAALGVFATTLLQQLGVFDILGILRFGINLSVAGAIGIAAAAFDWSGAFMSVDAVLLAVYLVVMFTPMMDAPARRWVRDDAPATKRLDAVVVLSGYVKADTELAPEAVERLVTGMEMVKAGVAPRLITTRVVVWIDGRRIVSDSGQRRYVHLANLDSAWTEVDSVGTTHDEATRVAALLAPASRRTVAVVTSPMHTRRACATFEQLGFTVECVPARESLWLTWHPSSGGDRLAAFRDYFYERLGMVKYRYEGWITHS